MHNATQESVAAYPSGNVVDKDANPETTLGSAYSPVDYMSITSFPRLPEDDTMSAETTQRSRKEDDNVLSEQDTGVSQVTSGVIMQNTFTLNAAKITLACKGIDLDLFSDESAVKL